VYNSQTALTVAHVLLDCNCYNVVRQRESSLQELFDTVNAQNVLSFIVSYNLADLFL